MIKYNLRYAHGAASPVQPDSDAVLVMERDGLLPSRTVNAADLREADTLLLHAKEAQQAKTNLFFPERKLHK